MILRDISYVPVLYKIFDDLIVNISDNNLCDKKMNCICIDINSADNKIVVYNNGHGTPFVIQHENKIYISSLIFDHLLSLADYNDDDKKIVNYSNYHQTLVELMEKNPIDISIL